jgi:hypothetical protein
MIEVIGKDRAGRSIVIIYGFNIGAASRSQPLTEQLIERIQCYVIRLLDTLSCVPFVVLFCCSGLEVETYPEHLWVSTIFDVITHRYNSNLQGTYMLHASYMLRMYIYMNSTGFKDYQVIDSLKQLNEFMDVSSISHVIVVAFTSLTHVGSIIAALGVR